jgi:DNA-binding XRE family transcriptional regulator
MNELTEGVQILRDAAGQPAFAVLPYAIYQALIAGSGRADPLIPAAVVNLALDHAVSAARAWREYLGLTQVDVARRAGMTQSAYAQLEAKKVIRKSSRVKIAAALGIVEAQLDF